MPFESSAPPPQGFYRQSDFHKLRIGPDEFDRLVALWVNVLIMRTRATRPESGGGPVGKAFLVSREFYRITESIGLDPEWTKKLLRPYAGNAKPFPRLVERRLKEKSK